MKKLFLLLPFLALLMGCDSKQDCCQSPVLTVEGGQIAGLQINITTNAGPVTYFAYKGIPYAAAPIGDLRWKEPQPVIPWEGVRQCVKYEHPGYQAVHYPGGYATEWGYGEESPYSEDCL